MFPRNCLRANLPVPCCRVRLYRRGDSIADAVLQRKLQREYRRVKLLYNFIYWTHVGREGALHFKELLRQKKMAENLQESIVSGVTVERAQKMIKR